MYLPDMELVTLKYVAAVTCKMSNRPIICLARIQLDLTELL